jgi:hypothetical protein
MGTMRHPAIRPRYRGVLRLWNEPRFFGFIDVDSNTPLPTLRESVFAHRLNFLKGMKPYLGCRVEFELGPPISVGKPEQAVRVKILEEPTAGLHALLQQQGGV